MLKAIGKRMMMAMIALTMVTVCGLFAAEVYADDVEYYDLWISGRQVTSANKNNVFNDLQKSVSFDPETCTLRLDNAGLGPSEFEELDEKYYRGIYACNMRLTIELVGKNYLDGTEYMSKDPVGIRVEGSQSYGSLTITGEKGASLDINHIGTGISADDGINIKSGKLIVDYATKMGIGSGSDSLCDITIEGGDIYVDAGGNGIYTGNGHIYISGGIVNVLSEMRNGIYAFKNDASSEDILISGGRVTAASEGDEDTDDAIYASGKLKITDGVTYVDATSSNGSAIRAGRGMTVEKDITEPEDGAVGEYYSEMCVGTVESGVFTPAKHVLLGELSKLYTVTFVDGQGKTIDTQYVEEGQDAVAPSDPVRDGYTFAGWDVDFTDVTEDLLVTAKWVENYPIWVGKTKVTNDNKNDVLGDGKVRYDSVTHTLTLDDPVIKDMYTSDNSFTAAIYSELPFTLSIKGKADIRNTAAGSGAVGIYASGSDLDINGDFNITAGYYGIAAYDVSFSGGKVTVDSVGGIRATNINVDGGTLTSVTDGGSALLALDSLKLGNDLKIVKPAGGSIYNDAEDRSVYIKDAEGNRATTVVISSSEDLFLVTFLDQKGNKLKIETVEKGSAASAPAVPARSGYKFTGWDKDISNVTEDMTVSPKWAVSLKGTTVKKAASLKKALKVSWNKQTAKVDTSYLTGYQLQLALNKKFTKGKKLVTVKGYKTVSKKVTKLKGGKKYYVRIRTYKVLNGKNYYSAWSKAKTGKTKK